MSGLLPTDTEAEATAEDDAEAGDVDSGELRVLTLDDEGTDRLLSSLSSDTARAIVTALHEEHRTASEIAEAVDTSVQNVRHHLGNLREAGLVRTAGTRYSVKGREMTVYAPASDSLVVCVGNEADKEGLLSSLERVLGAVGLLALASVAVEAAFGGAVGGVAGPETVPRVPDGLGAAGGALGILPPGAAFFAGGLLVLAAVAALEHWG
jgi:DNA-binding transcriptional ArsR family regulator